MHRLLAAVLALLRHRHHLSGDKQLRKIIVVEESTVQFSSCNTDDISFPDSSWKLFSALKSKTEQMNNASSEEGQYYIHLVTNSGTLLWPFLLSKLHSNCDQAYKLQPN